MIPGAAGMVPATETDMPAARRPVLTKIDKANWYRYQIECSTP